MANDDTDSSEIVDTIVSDFFSGDIDYVSLHELLGDKDVKLALTAEIRDLGFPAPGIVYRLIVHFVGGCERFLGGSIKSRLQAYVDRTPKLAGVLQKIVSFQQGVSAQNDLKTSFLNSINDGASFPDDIAADEASSLEMVIALHTAKKLEGLNAAIAATGDSLIEDFRNELAEQLNQLVAPNLSWLDEVGSAEELSAFDRLKYTSGIDQFVGRAGEIDLLQRFAGDPSFGGKIFNFRWMLLTGDGGEGKTRLSYHFCRRKLGANWTAGKLDLDSLNAFGNPAKWRPVRPTFIVIDYAQTAPEQISRLLTTFSSRSAQYEFPVRLLLLERHAEASWTGRMLPETGNKPVIMQHNFGEGGVKGTHIGVLDPAAIVSLMRGRIEQARVEVPEDKALLNFATSIDRRVKQEVVGNNIVIVACPRPLFALAASDAIIGALKNGGKLPNSLDQEEVFAGIIKRDRDTVWRPVVRDESELRRYQMGLAIATLAQGVTLSDLSIELLAPASGWLPPLPPNYNETALTAFGFRDGNWPQMEPDILGEFFLSDQLLNEFLNQQERNALILGAMSLRESRAHITLWRLALDFPERFAALDLPAVVSASTNADAILNFARLVTVMTSIDLAPSISHEIFKFIWAGDHWKNDARIGTELAMSMFNMFIDNNDITYRDRLDDTMATLDSLRIAHPKNNKIAQQEARAAVNTSLDAAYAGEWELENDMQARLADLRIKFPRDRDIAVKVAQAAFNFSIKFKNTNYFDRVDRMFSTFDDLRTAFSEDQEIAYQDAKASVNITLTAANASHWGRVDSVRKRLDVLRLAFPHSLKIAQQDAMAAMNVASVAGNADNWNHVDRMLAKIDDLRLAFPRDQTIVHQDAKASVNIFVSAAKAGQSDRVQAMLARIDSMIDAFGDVVITDQGRQTKSLQQFRANAVDIERELRQARS